MDLVIESTIKPIVLVSTPHKNTEISGIKVTLRLFDNQRKGLFTVGYKVSDYA